MTFIKTGRNRIQRLPGRGHYDRETIYRILDEALVCHVGFAIVEQPYGIPINFARMEDDLVLHGARASRLLKHIEAGTPVRDELLTHDIPIPQYVTHYARR